MKKRITIWLDDGKPTKVKTTVTEEFYLEDFGKLMEVLKEKEPEGAAYAIKQKPND